MSSCNAGDLGFISGLGRSPGGGHGNPLQYSSLENPHGQRILAGYSPCGHKVGHNWAAKHTHTQKIHLTLLFQKRLIQSCLTLCSSLGCSMPGFPVHHHLLELAQTHVYWVSDDIQPSHPLSPPFVYHFKSSLKSVCWYFVSDFCFYAYTWVWLIIIYNAPLVQFWQ